jgi:hypothetical protein
VGEGGPAVSNPRPYEDLHRLRLETGLRVNDLLALATKNYHYHYRLPRIPVKETDLRRLGFEQAYGQGAVELDALEALVPGELARLLRQAAEPYVDRTLQRHLDEVRAEAQRQVEGEGVVAPFRANLQRLANEATTIALRYRADLERLDSALQRELEPLRERLDAVRQAAHNEIEALEVELPERSAPETNPPSENACLFDAAREYLDQLDFYKRRRINGST